MKKLISIIILLVLVLYTSGCVDTSKATEAPEEISEDLSEIDELDEELDDSELDDLSKDLENIDW